jgi:hypothetical protein
LRAEGPLQLSCAAAELAIRRLLDMCERSGRNPPDQRPSQEIEGDAAMKSEKVEVARGSGNVFRDLGHDNADAAQFKAILADAIIKALDREHLPVRAAHARTGIAAADFSRIRNADLGRFTVDPERKVLYALDFIN